MTDHDIKGGCTCGQVRFKVTGTPLFRAYCHCTICQLFNEADFADILVLQSRDISVDHRESIAFKTYRNPPLLKRGRCSACEGVAIEEMTIPMLPKLTIIPTQTLRQTPGMPEPLFHMFYHRRTMDVADDLPKYSGYVRSQTRFSVTLLTALLSAQGRH